jgi:hypothetical protein
MILPSTTVRYRATARQLRRRLAGWLPALLGLAALPAQAQLLVTGSTPAPQAPAAPVSGPVGITFS